MAVFRAVVIGSRRNAEIHHHLLSQFDQFEFAGFYDPDDADNTDALGTLVYSYELCNKADVFIFDRHIKYTDPFMVENFVKMGKHILFDGFPSGMQLNPGRLLSLQQEAGCCIQVANTLYNKPLFTTVSQFVKKPRFVKLEKNTRSPKPGGFTEWLFTHLAQELDIIIRIADSGIRHISAKPLFLFGENPDMVNIHIEFDNDAVCHISAGRAIESGIHKLRMFQQDKVFHVDFHENQLLEFRPANPADQLSILNDNSDAAHHEFIEINRPVMPFDPWKMELRNFLENINKKLTPSTGMAHYEQVSMAAETIAARVTRKYAGV